MYFKYRFDIVRTGILKYDLQVQTIVGPKTVRPSVPRTLNFTSPLSNSIINYAINKYE